MIHYISSRISASEKAVKNTITLLNEDCSIPFIARYRKEKTGNLDEVTIAQIANLKEEFEALEKRKNTVIKAIEEQGLLGEELRHKILKAATITQVEDLYLPFKKKRKTKAEVARKNGLEPLAKILMHQKTDTVEATANRFLNGEVTTKEKALEGARHIIAEWINDRADIRNIVRKDMYRFATITSKVVPRVAKEDSAQRFKDYFDWSENLSRIPSHRILALLRAEKEGYLKIKVVLDDVPILEKLDRKLIRANNASAAEVQLAIDDAYKRLLFPSLSNEALQTTKSKADEDAIKVFAKNLQQLLLGAPLGEKRILAIDPGFRTGCKIVCLNKQGNILYHDTVFPHAPHHKKLEAEYLLKQVTKKQQIEAIAIGNGTASRETEQFIRAITFSSPIEVFVVSEAGASIYSASPIARAEFPALDITVRGAISIGRRLADPLAELVKIDAKSIGVGQYQHDVDQTKLKNALDNVVAHCVNKVGVNINTASASLLQYVSGVGPKLAENIVRFRDENGGFTSKKQIKKVPRLGEKAFEQSAGFLRIKNGENPLDDSGVHPECYALVKKMAKDHGYTIHQIIRNKEILDRIELQNYTTDTFGIPTLRDIIKELEKPGLDPRAKAKAFRFNEEVKKIEDLKIGMELPGIINNITNFGCFVDIGLKESGLVHISNLSNTFVKDVNEHVKLQQQVTVKVLEVDLQRKRIQLSMRF
ncbi:RNA-binding transcriptional accessory protein [Tenacibaculum sp. SG-28]|nr:RNA-binding transcriptional accessory protein [Tenacibaculum sp. SG-28]